MQFSAPDKTHPVDRDFHKMSCMKKWKQNQQVTCQHWNNWIQVKIGQFLFRGKDVEKFQNEKVCMPLLQSIIWRDSIMLQFWYVEDSNLKGL